MEKKKNFNKKVIFLIIIFLLFLIGGVFWWQERENMMKGSIKDFLIKETREGKIVENKREGLKLKTPEAWRVEKAETVFSSEWGVNFFSADAKISPNYILEKGCAIQVNIENKELEFETTNAYIKKFQEEQTTLEEDGFEIIEIAQHRALKELVYENPEMGSEFNVRIPIKDNKNISFVLYSSATDKEKCLQEFDKFLSTVAID